MDCTFCVLRMSAHQILTMCSLFSYVHYDILSMCCVYTQGHVQLPHPPSTQSSVARSWCSSTATQGLPATPFSFQWSRTHSQFPRPVPGTLYVGCSFVGLCVRNVRMHMQNCVCVYVWTHMQNSF